MFNASKGIRSIAQNCLLAAPLLLAPLAHASYMMPEEIEIDINWVPDQIDLDYVFDSGTSDETTTVEVSFFGVFFATYASERNEPWFNAGYAYHDPEERSFDLSEMLRVFLFEDGIDEQTFNFINRVSLNDTYIFGFASAVYYIPSYCVPYEDEDCPPILVADGYGETLITFYDGDDGTDSPTEVSLPGSLPLAAIAAMGVFWRGRRSKV